MTYDKKKKEEIRAQLNAYMRDRTSLGLGQPPCVGDRQTLLAMIDDLEGMVRHLYVASMRLHDASLTDDDSHQSLCRFDLQSVFVTIPPNLREGE